MIWSLTDLIRFPPPCQEVLAHIHWSLHPRCGNVWLFTTLLCFLLFASFKFFLRAKCSLFCYKGRWGVNRHRGAGAGFFSRLSIYNGLFNCLSPTWNIRNELFIVPLMVAKYLISAAECLRSTGYYQSRSYHSYHHHNHSLEAPLQDLIDMWVNFKPCEIQCF